VQSAKSVNVSGAIEAAEVWAGRDVIVRGGILGHHRGKVHADGEIVAKFCEQAELRAKGDIKMARLIMDSRIHTDRRLCAERAALIGGLSYAREGAEVASLGSGADIPTTLVLGVHWEVLKETRRIDRSIDEMHQAVARMHELADSLLAEIDSLPPSQRERVTELLLRIQELDVAIAEREQRRDRLLRMAGMDASPAVTVSKMIHAGARIRIHNREVVFPAEIKGPVRVEKRLVEGVREFVAVHQLTGSVTVLNSAYIQGDPTPLYTIY
jgi:hypothetical protein